LKFSGENDNRTRFRQYLIIRVLLNMRANARFLKLRLVILKGRQRRAAGAASVGAGYSIAPLDFAGLSPAFFAQSSQQTVTSLSPTFTLIPPSLISQVQMGHFFVVINSPFDIKIDAKFVTVAGDCQEGIVTGRGKSDCQFLAYFAKRSAAKLIADGRGVEAELAAEGKGEVAVVTAISLLHFSTFQKLPALFQNHQRPE
jgi:hypothetical protein